MVAGPIASGKTTHFRRLAEASGFDAFNVDDRMMQLHGSYQDVSAEVNARAKRERDDFVQEHVDTRRSFLIETTLRTPAAIEQAQKAKDAGFRTEMVFVAVRDADENVRRGLAREAGGGRNTSEQIIRDSRHAAFAKLPEVLRRFDRVTVLDNSVREREAARVVLKTRHGAITYERGPRPEWLYRALCGTEYDLG